MVLVVTVHVTAVAVRISQTFQVISETEQAAVIYECQLLYGCFSGHIHGLVQAEAYPYLEVGDWHRVMHGNLLHAVR